MNWSFAKDPIKSKIAYVVGGVHLLFFLLILFGSPFPPKKTHKPLIVKTVVPRAAPAIKSATSQKVVNKGAATAAPIAKQIAPAEKKLPVKKQTVVKKEAVVEKKSPPTKSVKLPTPKTAPLKTAPRSNVSESLLRELEESIAKIEERSDKSRKDRRAPNKATPIRLQIDAVDVEFAAMDESDYITTLTQHLHESLHLPDFGEVKIELTLRQDGSVAKLVVLKAESEKNKKYLETSLPRLRFPHLDGSYAKMKECSFILNFCNEL